MTNNDILFVVIFLTLEESKVYRNKIPISIMINNTVICIITIQIFNKQTPVLNFDLFQVTL